MKKFFYLISVAALLAGFTSCNDDEFLKEEPKYFYTLDNAFSTPAQVDQVLVNCYSTIRAMYTFSSEGTTTFAFRGGNGTDMYDVASIRKGNQFNDYSNLTPERHEYYDIYTNWYKLISYANLALYGAGLETLAWDSPEEKGYAEAQARFFRAWAYMNLGEEFGGVPLVTEFCREPRFDYVRSTREETYQFAIDELETILPDMPETSPERGRLVRGAAEHTLAQLYLDLGTVLVQAGDLLGSRKAYQQSASYASRLIDGGTYSLMTERFGTRKSQGPVFYYAADDDHKTPEHTYASAGVDIQGNVFWDLFQLGNQCYQDGNRESVWIASADYDACLEEDGYARLPYSRIFGPVFRDPQAGVLQGTMEDVGGRGVCFVMPTAYSRDLVYEGRWSDDMRNSEAVLRRTFIGNVPGTKYYGKVVPWSVIYKNGQSSSVVEAAYTQCYPISCKIQTDQYPDDATGGNKSNLYRDEYLIRLAETVLLRAEAYYRMGEDRKAAADINLLRARARCTYMVQPYEVTLDLILDERARELLYEENRWNTLLRMGGTVAVDRIKEYAYWEYPRTATMKQFNLWPIPQSVIDSNLEAIIEQNEGWK